MVNQLFVIFASLSCLQLFGEESMTLSKDGFWSSFTDLRELQRRAQGWHKYVRDFRDEHNFSMDLGANDGAWDIETITNEVEGEHFFTSLEYAFHLKLYRSFGWALGSRIGYVYTPSTKVENFRPSGILALPGIIGGPVHNVSPVFRYGFIVDWHMERLEAFVYPSSTGKKKIFFTAEALQLNVFADFFLDLFWAIRLNVGTKRLTFQQPRKATGFDVDVDISRSAYWGSIGLAYHVL